MSDLLQEAMSAEQRGDISLAKQLLSQALIQDPNNETAWMMMSEAVEDIRLRRNCLERVLAINPNNIFASTALTKLDTSPLLPVTRGERDKPLNPSMLDKTPPFTPPFTWGSDQGQYLALGDLTYSDLPGEQPAQPDETVPTFDWANESEEPDKTIDRLFNAANNPEFASESLPDNDFSWLDENPSVSPPSMAQDVKGNKEHTWPDELVGTEVEPLPEGQFGTVDDFTVSAEPEYGLDTFISKEQPEEYLSSDHQLWDNPKARKDRMIFLSNTSIMYASPQESDIPHILGLFAENKMIRDLLGDNARLIKLESIRRLSANPAKADLTIDYTNTGKRTYSHKLTFSSPQVRDEVLTAIQLKPGVNFHRTIQTFRLVDKIVPPVTVLIFLIFLCWFLYIGLPLLGGLSGPELGILQSIISFMQSFVSFVGTSRLLLVIIILGVLTVGWLLFNLMKPTKLIILERN